MHPVIDTHTHLCDHNFDRDRSAVLDRARDRGVQKIITLSETMEDARRNLELADGHPMLLAAAGLYPTHLDREAAEEMKEFITGNRNRLVAIGEVGLDFRVVEDPDDRDLQGRIFEEFIDLSRELDLPLNVHSRSAGRHALSVLLEKRAHRVQLHAFDGKAGSALPALEAGYFFSIPPSIERSRQKQKLLRQLPLSCLLVETDSPVLGPDPQERNEPSNAVLSLRWIAQTKEISLEAAAEAVYENTRRLYGPVL